jgi:hypothetical protein
MIKNSESNISEKNLYLVYDRKADHKVFDAIFKYNENFV